MSAELDMRRVSLFALAAMTGARPQDLDPALLDGPTTAERLFLVSRAEAVVRNWQDAGVLPRARSVLDVTPSEAHRLARKSAVLEALRLDASLGWRDPQPLGDRLRQVDHDRRTEVLRRLRAAGFPLPPEDVWGALD